MVIEYNTYGSILLQYLRTIFPQRNEFEDEMILRFKHRHDSKTLKAGLRLKADNKAVFCQNFKKLIEANRIFLNDIDTVNEASLFGTLKNGSYGAQMGHDDAIMTAINATEFYGTTDYADFVEELLDVKNLDYTFREVQKNFNKWNETKNQSLTPKSAHFHPK